MILQIKLIIGVLIVHIQLWSLNRKYVLIV